MSKELIERAQNIARQLTYNDDTIQAQAKHTLLECAVRIEELIIRSSRMDRKDALWLSELLRQWALGGVIWAI